MAGKKNFGTVPTKPKSVEDFMSEDGEKPQEATAPEPKQEEKTAQAINARKDAKADRLAKWGTYTVQRGYRLPIALLEALQGYVADQQKTQRRYNETQAVCEAITKFLEEKGVTV